MLWQHGEKEFEKFLEILDSYNPIGYQVYYRLFKEKISFLDAEVLKKGNQLATDFYIKPSDTQQYLHASSCLDFYSKKSIRYSQALRLNHFCSENSLFNKRCNDLEIRLRESGYSDKLGRKQILKVRKFSRT